MKNTVLIKQYLQKDDYISSKYRNRYNVILERLDGIVDEKMIQNAIEKKVHVHLMLKSIFHNNKSFFENFNILKSNVIFYEWINIENKKIKKNTVYCQGEEWFRNSMNSLFKIKNEACLNVSPLLTTQVPLHPDRNANMIIYNDDVFVTILWKTDKIKYRFELLHKFTELLKEFPESEIPIEVNNNYIVYVNKNEVEMYTTVISPFLGITIEDGLRESIYSKKDRYRIIKSLAVLRNNMIRKGISWQGFAPRNMFYRNDKIYLIDFEEIYNIDDKWNFYSSLYWHKIWFQDCLSDDEFKLIFAGDEKILEDIYQNIEGAPDAFERAWFGKKIITWNERKELFELTLTIEKAYLRKNPIISQEKMIYGHQLGHFWGDFLEPDKEVAIYRFAKKIGNNEGFLLDFLECFEIAMEADIIDLILHSVKGSFKIKCKHTLDLIGLLDLISPTDFSWVKSRIAKDINLNSDPLDAVDKVKILLNQKIIDINYDQIGMEFMGKDDNYNLYKSKLEKAIQVGLGFQHGEFRNNKFLNYADTEKLISVASESLPKEGSRIDSVVEDFIENIAKYSISQADKTYLSFPDSGNSLSSMIGSILGQFLNQNLVAVSRSAPVGTFIELQIIEWLRELVGYETKELNQLNGIKDAGGVWSTGGYMSNFIGILAALRNAFPNSQNIGIRGLSTQPAIAVCGQNTHYSILDAADRLGIGRENVLTFDAKKNFKSDPEKLEALLKCPPDGKKIFVVVGIAGNTRTTSVDELEKIAIICKKYDVWYHIDACHGGNLLFNKKLKDTLLSGIDKADSIAVDPHKGLFTTYPSSYVLFKERGKLIVFSRHDQVKNDSVWDWGLITPFFGSRGFESLKTWFMIKTIGSKQIGKIVEYRNCIMKYLESQIKKSPFLVSLNEVEFYRIVFVVCPHDMQYSFKLVDESQKEQAIKLVRLYTHELCTKLYKNELLSIDEHTLQDVDNKVGLGKDVNYNVMAISIGNPLLTIDDIDNAMNILNEQAKLMIEGFREIAATKENSSSYFIGGPAGWN